MKTLHFEIEHALTANLTITELTKAQAMVKEIADTCAIVTTAKLDQDLSWSCSNVAGELTIPKQLCLESVYIALHECGHYTLGHEYGDYTSRFDERYNVDQLKFENEANEFAFAKFKSITSNPEAIATVKALIAKQIGCYEEQVAERRKISAEMKDGERAPDMPESFEEMMQDRYAEYAKQARKENIKTLVLSSLAGVGAAHIIFSILTSII